MEREKDILATLLAAANHVPGFDPTQYAVATENGGMYLKVFHRKAWFRLKYPAGKIITTPVVLKDQTCVFKAEVFLDRNDEQPISVAYASRCFMEGNPYSMYYVENAETAAVGRALATAGFNIGFTPGEDDEPELADAPTGEDKANTTADEKDKVETPKKRGRKKKEDTEKVEETTEKTADGLPDKPVEESQEEQPENPNYSSLISPEEGSAVELPESAQAAIDFENLSDGTSEMTLDEATKVKVTFGRNNGVTLGELMSE